MRGKAIHPARHVATGIIVMAFCLLLAMRIWPERSDVLGIPAVVLLIGGIAMVIAFTGRRA